eukprot:snap_masked-scaffold_39-processed-gene-2.22-mRNA-1 protein AED:1.00 eAED:1.00 QI:0/0/0/0/1/1/2/0/254
MERKVVRKKSIGAPSTERIASRKTIEEFLGTKDSILHPDVLEKISGYVGDDLEAVGMEKMVNDVVRMLTDNFYDSPTNLSVATNWLNELNFPEGSFGKEKVEGGLNEDSAAIEKRVTSAENLFKSVLKEMLDHKLSAAVFENLTEEMKEIPKGIVSVLEDRYWRKYLLNRVNRFSKDKKNIFLSHCVGILSKADLEIELNSSAPTTFFDVYMNKVFELIKKIIMCEADGSKKRRRQGNFKMYEDELVQYISSFG